MNKVFNIAVLIINGKESHSVDTADARGLDLIKSLARHHRDTRPDHHVELVRRNESIWAGGNDGFIAFGAWE